MLILTHINKTYGGVEVFKDFTLEIPKGEIVSIFGPNGSGKTTLLNLISGITESEQGRISFDEKVVGNYKVGYVFQDYRKSLFPWMNIEKNIHFPLSLGDQNKSNRQEEIGELLKMFSTNINLKAYPYQLSGGQQQLAAILRSLIIQPDIYLLDEPFSSLDYQTTISMLEICSDILERRKITTLFVSHDIDEAILFSKTIIVLGEKPAKVINIYNNPLPYPRKLEMTTSPEFIKLKKDMVQVFNHQFLVKNN